MKPINLSLKVVTWFYLGDSLGEEHAIRLPLVIISDRGGTIIFSHPRVIDEKSTFLSAIVTVALAIMTELWGEREEMIVGYGDLDILVKLKKAFVFVFIKPKYIGNDVGWSILNALAGIMDQLKIKTCGVLYLGKAECDKLSYVIREILDKYGFRYEEVSKISLYFPEIKVTDIVALTSMGSELLKKKYGTRLAQRFLGSLSEKCVQLLEGIDGIRSIREIADKVGLDKESLNQCVERLRSNFLIKPVPRNYADIIILSRAINALIGQLSSLLGKPTVKRILKEIHESLKCDAISKDSLEKLYFSVNYVDNVNLRLLVLKDEVSLETLRNIRDHVYQFWCKLLINASDMIGEEVLSTMKERIKSDLAEIYGEEKSDILR